MKRTRIVFLITLLFTLSFQLIAIQDTEQDTVTRFNVLESTPTSTTLEFSLPEFKLVKQELNGIEFDKIETQCDGFVPELGQPELPLYSTMVAIPYSGSVSLEVLNKTSFQVDNFTAIPAQDYTIENEMERSFALDEDFYNSNIEYPVQAENISDPMIVRDFRVVSLTFSPFTYNPSTRSLTVSENITYKLTYNDEPSVNEMEAPTMYSPSFEPIYSSMIANYELVVDRTIPSHNMRLLMVYGGSSDAQYLAKMDEFVKWKKQKGYKVTTASTDDIGSSTTDVKAYIQSKYNNIYTRPEYVTLIGDVGGSFDISCFTVSGGASDYPYTHLAGDDIMGDVFIGRMPIENVDDFLTMANKAFIYERDPVPAPPTWYNHMLLVGYTNSAGQSSMYVNKFMKDSGLRVNPNYTFTELYGTPSSSTMQQTLNQGAAFFMYRGWIGMNGWDHPSEGEFTNGNKMTHCIINTCSTGDFNGTDATDAIVRYGSPAAPKGAITAIGMATAGTHTLMNNVLSSQTTNGIFSLGYRNMSAPLLSSKLLLYMVYHDFIPAYAVNFPGWCNLMGDPTVEVYIGPPQALTAEYPTEVFPGQTCYPVTVEDSNGTPMEDAIVTLVSDDFQLILHTDANGNAIFELPNDLAENYVFTVTASQHDYIPQYEDITVLASDGIQIADFTILDAVGGNDDGAPDASETFELNVTLTNPGTTDINAGTVEISTDDPYITIIQNSSAFGTIAPGATVANATPYEMHINGSMPPVYMASIRLDVVGEDYHTYLGLDIRNANIDVSSYTIFDDNNILEPGETAWMSLELINNGQHSISGLTAELSSTSNLVYFDDNSAYYGNATPGTVITNITDGLSITARSQLLTGTDIIIDLRLFNDDGYEEFDKLYISTGSQNLGHPSGPDAFGHYVYHNLDTGWADAPVYNWVEIAPSEGGPGTEFSGHSDTGTDGGDGDITMSDTIDDTGLPFTFTWYGVDYDEVYICTNGFMSFAPTEVGTFRNFPIPGPMSPQPVIAPFWDDMYYIGSEGIYHWYDTANNYFVIEWYDGHNGFNNSYHERFQVILFDPAYYPTSTGDGMVKIQYHTHNDVDVGDTSAYPPLAGQYSTVGFCNYDGTDGLQYVFDQDYGPTSQPITNETALLITGEPFLNVDPDLTLDTISIDDANANGYIEPGEFVELNFNIMNSGMGDAENVVANLTSIDANLGIIVGTSNYDVIPSGDGTAFSNTVFTAMIAPSCPIDYEIPVTLTLATPNDTWVIDGSILVTSPSIEFVSAMISDYELGNGDGIANQDEDVYLILNLNNPSPVDMMNVQTTLTPDQADVSVGESVQNLDYIPANSMIQFVYPLNIANTVADNTIINFSLEMFGTGSQVTTEAFSLIVGTYSLTAAGVITGTITADEGTIVPEDVFVAAGDYANFASDTADYSLYVPIGMHSVMAYLDHYVSDVVSDIAITNGIHIVSGTDLVLNYLYEATALDATLDNLELSLVWTAPVDNGYAVSSYDVYKSFAENNFEMIGNVDTEELMDTVTLDNISTYYVVAVYEGGVSIPSIEFIFDPASGLTGEDATPLITELYGNFPNPFNPVTNIAYSLAVEGNVAINIYNVRGQHVRTLLDEVQTSGKHVVQWNGVDDNNNSCASGLYMYRFQTKGVNTIKKAMLLK